MASSYFDGLSKFEDYVLTATIKGSKPAERKISQYDSRLKLYLVMQLDPVDTKTADSQTADVKPGTAK